jgi:thiamine biosynthesis protein ThiS
MSTEVNGKPVKWVENETVTMLLKRIKYSFPLVVVKINGNIVSKEDFNTTYIPDQAQITIIDIVSGG